MSELILKNYYKAANTTLEYFGVELVLPINFCEATNYIATNPSGNIFGYVYMPEFIKTEGHTEGRWSRKHAGFGLQLIDKPVFLGKVDAISVEEAKMSLKYVGADLQGKTYK